MSTGYVIGENEMKKIIFNVMLGMALTAASFGQEAPTDASTEEVVKGPSIFVEETDYNFGTVDNQSSIEHTFVIQNVGDETLEISNARPACGCTVAQITEKSVPPGGTSELTAKLSLRGRKGHQSKAITISSNDPKKPQYRLLLVGDVHQAIEVRPDRLIYGQMAPGKEITLGIELIGTSEQEYLVTKIETNFETLIAKAEKEEAGKNHNITVTLTAPETVGPVNGVVRITTDHPQRPTIDVPVAANVVGELVYAPSELVVPANAGENPLTRYIVVRKGTLESFEISEVVTPNEGITSKVYPFGDQGYRVQIDNITVNDDLNGKNIRILTSAENMGEISVPFTVR